MREPELEPELELEGEVAEILEVIDDGAMPIRNKNTADEIKVAAMRFGLYCTLGSSELGLVIAGASTKRKGDATGQIDYILLRNGPS